MYEIFKKYIIISIKIGKILPNFQLRFFSYRLISIRAGLIVASAVVFAAVFCQHWTEGTTGAEAPLSDADTLCMLVR